MGKPLFFYVYEAVVEVLMNHSGLFEGPWRHDEELARAFCDWARVHLAEIYADTSGTAIEIELLLHDEDPKLVYETLEAFVEQLPPAQHQSALRSILAALDEPPMNPQWAAQHLELLSDAKTAVEARLRT